MKNSLILSAILGAVLAWEDTSKEQTVYSRVLETKDKKFNIIQLGDLNYSSQDDYEETTTLINNLIRVIDPQLVVITGDIVNPSVAQAATYNRMHHEAMRPILDAEIPWLWTGGANVSGLSRDQLLGIDQELSFEKSWSGFKWDTLTSDAKFTDEMIGEFTARIPVVNKGKGIVADLEAEVFSIYAFDTEKFECSEKLGLPGTNCIGSDSVSWFMSQQAEHSHKYIQRDFVFMHQPIQEFMFAANVQEVYGIKEQAINCQAVNSGLFAAALTLDKTAWIAAGGDPFNDFMTIYHDIHISTGRKSGKGDQPFSTGARVFEINAESIEHVKVHSYSVDQDGNKNPGFKVRYPPSFSVGYQHQCNVDPYEGLLNNF